MSEEKRRLDERESAREAAELRRFAREHSGTELDLIPELEAAAVAELGRPKRRRSEHCERGA